MDYKKKYINYSTKIKRAIKDKSYIFRQRMKFFFRGDEQVYICQISYYRKKLVHFGANDVKTPFKAERQITGDIIYRKLEDGSLSYITHQKGEYVVGVFNVATGNDLLLILYRPRKFDFFSRDGMLTGLFLGASYLVEDYEEIISEKYDKGEISLEEMNDRTRKSNVVKLELEQLTKTYCHTNI